MKQIPLTVLVTFLLITSCSSNPQDLLHQAQAEIRQYQSVNYIQQAFYPNPMGEVDRVEASIALRKNENSVIGYDFLNKTKNEDYVHLDGEFKAVNHLLKTVLFFPENQLDQVKKEINGLREIRYAPITFLSRTDWEFERDTVIDGQKLSVFYRVETDEMVDGNTIFTEQHLFINPVSKLLEKWERSNYYNGNLQRVVVKYLDYNFEPSDRELTYDYPIDYISVPYGKTNERMLLQEGAQAPVFSVRDLTNKPWNLEDYRGKKVLIDFSVINCGYCKLAIEYMNQQDYQLADDISAVYINPIDQQAKVSKYDDVMNISFPVISEAKQLGEIYGVSAYPTFFLIDENGMIERAVVGFDQVFLESLKGD